MIKVLNSDQSSELDILSIDNKTISENQLIDNAGKATAYHIIENISDPFNKKYLCIAGVGKNGLDAIVCNYYLNLNNINSKLLIIDSKKINFESIHKYINKKKFYTIEDTINYQDFDWIIEGIFGTGLNRDIEGDFSKTIESLSLVENILSIDIPSGIYADNGVASNTFLNARHTISFAFPKLGHFLSTGYSALGKLFLYPIGHDSEAIDSKIKLINKHDISNLFRPSNPTAHKYLKGKVLSLSGSSSYTGAALLSSKAAICSGAGVLKQLLPSSLHSAMSMNKETIDILIDDNQNGFLSIDNYKEIEEHFDWTDCFIIGPGLSPSTESIGLASKILKNFKASCILDASGFLCLSNYPEDAFSSLPQKTILTPHYGELSRILKISNEELKNNTIDILTDLSKKLENRILVLKGPNTIIVNGDSQMYIISNGNQLLSTAGSGDVLTGIIASYVASGYSLEESAILGAYIHSECSNLLQQEKYENISASHIIDFIPKAQFGLKK